MFPICVFTFYVFLAFHNSFMNYFYKNIYHYLAKNVFVQGDKLVLLFLCTQRLYVVKGL